MLHKRHKNGPKSITHRFQNPALGKAKYKIIDLCYVMMLRK